MRIVLLGAPGCGKGTQGQRLAATYKIPEISTGDLLREAVAAGTALGKAAKAVMDAGQLVSDDIVLAAIRERLKLGDTSNGFILDGFPRNTAQAEQLDELLDQLGQPIDLAVLIEVDVDMIMQRLLGRRTCTSCGASYNTFYSPPRMDDSCDECGGRLKRRSDDNEETIGNRLRIYETQSLPVIERYREQGRLRVVRGLGEIEDVFKALRKVIEETKASFGDQQRAAAIRRAVVRKQVAQAVDSEKEPDKQTVAESISEMTAAEATAVPESTKGVAQKVVLGTRPAKKAAKRAVAGAKPAKKAAKKAVAGAKPAKKAAKKAVAGAKPAKKAAKKAVAGAKPAKKAAKKAVARAKPAKKAAKKVARKAATRTRLAKKAVAKAVVKKATAKKAVVKKTASKKASTKKKVMKKSPVKKKLAASRLPARKTAKKSAAFKTATSKRALKKSPARAKTALAKKAVAQKGVAKKKLAKKKVKKSQPAKRKVVRRSSRR